MARDRSVRDNLIAIARTPTSDSGRGDCSAMLDGVPVFAKSIYDMNGLKTTGSNAQWGASYPDRAAA